MSTPDMSKILAARHNGDRAAVPATETVTVADSHQDDSLADELYEPPARTVGRAGRGMANAVFYLTASTQAALNQFADDAYFNSRGRIKRWQAIEAVLRPALTPAALARASKRLGLDGER